MVEIGPRILVEVVSGRNLWPLERRTGERGSCARGWQSGAVVHGLFQGLVNTGCLLGEGGELKRTNKCRS